MNKSRGCGMFCERHQVDVRGTLPGENESVDENDGSTKLQGNQPERQKQKRKGTKEGREKR